MERNTCVTTFMVMAQLPFGRASFVLWRLLFGNQRVQHPSTIDQNWNVSIIAPGSHEPLAHFSSSDPLTIIVNVKNFVNETVPRLKDKLVHFYKVDDVTFQHPLPLQYRVFQDGGAVTTSVSIVAVCRDVKEFVHESQCFHRPMAMKRVSKPVWHPTEDKILFIGDNKSVYQCEPHGRNLLLGTLDVPGQSIFFHPSGKMCGIAVKFKGSHQTRIYELRPFRHLATIKAKVFKGKRFWDSSGTRLVLTTLSGGALAVWNTSSVGLNSKPGQTIPKCPTPPPLRKIFAWSIFVKVEWHPHASVFATHKYNGDVSVFDHEKLSKVCTFKTCDPWEHSDMAWSPSGDVLATCTTSEITLRETSTFTVIHTIRRTTGPSVLIGRKWSDFSQTGKNGTKTTALSWSRCGNLVCVNSQSENSLTVHHLGSNRLTTLECPERIRCGEWSATGKYLAVMCFNHAKIFMSLVAQNPISIPHVSMQPFQIPLNWDWVE